MCSRQCELRVGNNCGCAEEVRWVVRCQRITRAHLQALSDRSTQIRSKQDKVCAIFPQIHILKRAAWVCLYFNAATGGLKFASASSLWIDLAHIQKRSWWRSLDEIDGSKYTALPIGYEDMRFSTGAIDWDWSIDQGRADVLITAHPGSWQENKITDRFVIFVRTSLLALQVNYGVILGYSTWIYIEPRCLAMTLFD